MDAPAPPLPLLHVDSRLVVVCKPAGMPVHRSREHRDAGPVLLQSLRDQLGSYVHPVHRLDRATSGAVVFALDTDTARAVQEALTSPEAVKEYLALVRGLLSEPVTCERPLTNRDNGVVQEARTEILPLEVVSLGGAFGEATLVRCRIHTGRRHQIRRHLSHLRHQVLVDTTYGKGAINRHCREVLGIPRLFLHAAHLRFPHPDGGTLDVEAPLPDDLAAPLTRLRRTNPGGG